MLVRQEVAESEDCLIFFSLTYTSRSPVSFLLSIVYSGCCCDTRTAVIVVNIISLGFACLGLVSLAPRFDQPALERFGLLIAALVIGIICNALAIYGAFAFKKTFVMVGLVWFCVEAILSLALFLDFIGALVALVFAYPHLFLFREMRQGIITPANYPNERACCECCV